MADAAIDLLTPKPWPPLDLDDDRAVIVWDGDFYRLLSVEDVASWEDSPSLYFGPVEMPDPEAQAPGRPERVRRKLMHLAAELVREAWSLPESREMDAEWMKNTGIRLRKIHDDLPKRWPDA